MLLESMERIQQSEHTCVTSCYVSKIAFTFKIFATCFVVAGKAREVPMIS
jgi:hypothetical protein